MAERATGDRVAADMAPPNYRNAVQRLRGIVAKKSKIGEVNGEIADIYAKVEGLKVNKKAARIFLTLDALEQEDRVDIMRSLTGLIDSAGWDATGDLVDQSQGSNIVPMPGRRAAAPKGENAAGEDVEIDEAMRDVETMGADPAAAVTEDQTVKKSRAETAAAAARAKARAHLGEKAAPEPYTGDNSDLNPE